MEKLITNSISALLCFIASSLSSAGGVGGGSLYLPILNLVSGLDLKTATTFSALMVTSGSLSNVIFNLFFQNKNNNNKSSIDYDIALLSEPFMLLGVSVGVICNVMFPEWLITLLFALFLGFSTLKTFQAGFKCWNAESDDVMMMMISSSTRVVGHVADEPDDVEESLLVMSGRVMIPLGKLLVLMFIWLSFFLLHVFTGDKDGKILIRVRPCGFSYWLITLSQVPLAIGFTAYILYRNRKSQQDRPDDETNHKDSVMLNIIEALPVFVFPTAALLSGILGGLFGIGGGLLINPVLLQIGVPPQITAATTSFMVLFSSSMSMVQYLILGMKAIKEALVFSAICFVASIVGLVVIQRAIVKSGRASLIVFSVSTVMALSTASITCFGTIDIWRKYTKGMNMGFKLPC